MKYSEAKEAIEALSSKYIVELDKRFCYFNVNYKGSAVALVSTINQYFISVSFENNFKKLPFSNKLYMILAELAMTPLDERKENKKYYVKVFNNGFGYLNIDILNDNVVADTKSETDHIKTKFTNEAIEQLKKRDDIPLDWNKVTLEDAE